MSSHYVFDSHIGHRGRPGTSHLIDGVEYRYNSAGFRDLERKYSKPKQTTRVALIGDSFVEGYECEASRTIGPTLQHLLDTDPKIASLLSGSQINQIEVLSFGQAGFNPMFYWRLLKYIVLHYSPDLIFVNIFSFNDVAGLIPFKIRKEKNRYWIPPMDYYDVIDDHLVLMYAWLWRYRYILLAEKLKQLGIVRKAHKSISQFLDFLRQARLNSKSVRQKRIVSKWIKDYSPILAKGLFTYSVSEPETKRAYSICAKFIEMMEQEANEHGAVLGIVHLANADILSLEQFEREKKKWYEFYNQQSIQEYNYNNLNTALPNEKLRGVCSRLGIHFFDLNDYISLQYPSVHWKEIFYHYDRPNSWATWGHYTPQGNLFWAQMLREAIIKQLPKLKTSPNSKSNDEYNPYAYPLS